MDLLKTEWSQSASRLSITVTVAGSIPASLPAAADVFDESHVAYGVWIERGDDSWYVSARLQGQAPGMPAGWDLAISEFPGGLAELANVPVVKKNQVTFSLPSKIDGAPSWTLSKPVKVTSTEMSGSLATYAEDPFNVFSDDCHPS